jgi:GNAT superfamily N-acetyltransferase
VVALAGYRLQENLIHGQFLYVDDLVTLDSARGQGHGERLMTFLKAEAARLGCARLAHSTMCWAIAFIIAMACWRGPCVSMCRCHDPKLAADQHQCPR